MASEQFAGTSEAMPPSAFAAPFSWPRSGLEPLPWFPFTVASSRGETAVAARVAQRAERAYWYLRRVLGVAPRFRLLVLNPDDWRRFAENPTFGVGHFTGDGNLVVGNGPATAWHDVSRYLATCLPAGTLRSLMKVHGPDPVYPAGPDLSGVAEALIAHELAHIVADQAGAEFGRQWAAEAFANYALVAVLGETDSTALHRLGTLAEATKTLLDATPTVSEFEAAPHGLPPAAAVLLHLELTRAAYAAYADAQAEPLARWFAQARSGGAIAYAPDADHELGRMLARDVHPALEAPAARRNGWQAPLPRAA